MRYICCRSCLEDEGRREAAESMRSFERLSVSMSSAKTELAIWCNRHQITVAKIGIGGHLNVLPGMGLREMTVVDHIDEELKEIGG